MKQKSFKIILIFEAIFCLVFCSLQVKYPDIFSTMIAFPFEQIGLGLRALSLSGTLGNILAIIIYLLVSLIPFIYYLHIKKKGKNGKSDLILPILSVLLFVVIYYMINPGLFQVTVHGTGKMIFGCAFYSVLCGYFVLRILEKSVSADKKWLQKGLHILLRIITLVFVYIAFGECFGGIPSAIQSLQEKNNMTGDFFYGTPDLTITYVFLVLQSVVNAIPYMLDVVIVEVLVKVVDEMGKDSYSDIAVLTSKKLGKLCVEALVVTVVSNMSFNILQLIFQNGLYQINMELSLPIFSIAFVLAVLLLARYVQETQKIKQDYDLFV